MSAEKVQKNKVPDQTYQVLTEVALERARQEVKWGQQDFDATLYLAILSEELGEVARAIQQHRFNNYDPRNIREELIQVAAVAVQMVEAFDRGKCR